MGVIGVGFPLNPSDIDCLVMQMSASQFSPAEAKAEVIEKILAMPGYGEIGVQAYGDWVLLWLQNPDDKTQLPCAWTAIDPVAAMSLGENIARSGHAAESHDEVYGKKPVIVEQIRKRMLVAMEHLLKSEIINGQLDNPALTANRCVEIALTELT